MGVGICELEVRVGEMEGVEGVEVREGFVVGGGGGEFEGERKVYIMWGGGLVGVNGIE